MVPEDLPIAEFAFPGPLRDQLVAAILDGTKTTTTGLVADYEHEGSPYYSTARLWDDGILDPVQTRQALALGLSAAFNAPIPDAKFGVFRM